MSKNTTNGKDDEIWEELGLNDTALQSLLDNPLNGTNTSKLRDGTQHEGFDNNMGESWIYPNNLPCRSYQMSIVQSALYRNTLVVLPTGLGKTFIAAVVMYNFYRWYPRGKVIFMAPTRPLVNQQIEACQKIMPFPKKDTIELTGKLNRVKRSEVWKTKRVFFATPQVVQSDIFGGRQQDFNSVDESSFQEGEQSYNTEFPFEHIKLIVIDEAHKAKGKYAYTEVTQALVRHSKYFRVLALSATPGRTVDDVAEVCRNILISHIEVRWETSFDVVPYVHKKTMDTVVVAMDDKMKEIREQLLIIVDRYLRQLTESQVLSGSLTNINRNFLLYEQKRYRYRSLHMGRHPEHSAIVSNFSICVSIYHALELLERHGLRVFLNNFEEDEEGKNKFILKMDRRLNDLVENLKHKMGPNPFEFSAAPMTNGKIAQIPKDLDFGHPKFEKTRECLLKHFEENENSRAIVFCEYRESVMLIYRMLLQHVPLLRPRCFVGQGGTGSLRALTQKQQIQIMNDFRSGKSNILIATSIGEEGIDVGEVEVIICFDISTSNPMRFVQRIGRTGRKKNGHVIMMVTEGREQQLLREVLSNKDQTNKKLLKSQLVQQSLYKHSPRLVPTEFKPKCMQTFIKPPSDDEESATTKATKSTNNKKITPKKGGQDLRKFFPKKSQELDKEDLEFFENDTQQSQARPGVQTQQNIINKLDKMQNLFKDLQAPTATQTQKSIKSTQNKLINSQGSIKNFFTDLSTKKKTNDRLNKISNESKASSSEFSHATIDLYDQGDDGDGAANHTNNFHYKSTSSEIDAERKGKLIEFLKKKITTPEVLKRSKINDLGYHLKSKELSKEMKMLMLSIRPEYVKENLEKMQILNALYDTDTANYSAEENSIREINCIILDLFGGLEKVEKFLDDLELEKYKHKCLDSDSESEEEDPQEMKNFQKKLDNILAGYGDGKRHDNYDWIKQRFKDSKFYKDKIKSETFSHVQESMVYENFAEAEEYNTSHNFDDSPIIESKYSSQWLEFSKPDIAFKSTPVQRAMENTSRREEPFKKTSLLSKLEETKEEHEACRENNDTLNMSANTKQVQNMFIMLESKLRETSLNSNESLSPVNKLNAKKSSLSDRKAEKSTFNTSKSIQNDFEELEQIFRSKEQQHATQKSETESRILEASHLEDFNLPDDDDLLMAAVEAELKFTRNILEKDKIRPQATLQDDNKTPELPNLTNNRSYNQKSLNTTPELDLSCSNTGKSSTPAPEQQSKLCLQQELDIDMEAFMIPFPEEQELMRSTPSLLKKDFINNSTAALVRESPDLFAEEHIRSSIRKPIVCKNSSLASKLAAKRNLRKCSTSPEPPTSPLKPAFSTQHTKELLTSPSNRLATNSQKYEKSPSLFDMYLQSTKGKGRLPKSLTSHSTLTSAVNSTSNNNISKPLKDSQLACIPASQENESFIVIRNINVKASKRKIFDSDSEHEAEEQNMKNVPTVDSKGDEDTGSDFEEVAATQRPYDRCSTFHQRRKRRRFNRFIEKEARASDSDHSEDEDGRTLDYYAYDSVVVASDEDDPDQASTSHMQAMYLQSLKSPQQRRGTFKIPAARVYNDRSRIFSQAVLPDDTYSQYLPDSFVVSEEDSLVTDNGDISLCPLEKAEKILQQRRRARKMGLLEQLKKPETKTKIKMKVIEESSEDDDFE